jgi:hypothetical protein
VPCSGEAVTRDASLHSVALAEGSVGAPGGAPDLGVCSSQLLGRNSLNRLPNLRAISAAKTWRWGVSPHGGYPPGYRRTQHVTHRAREGRTPHANIIRAHVTSRLAACEVDHNTPRHARDDTFRDDFRRLVNVQVRARFEEKLRPATRRVGTCPSCAIVESRAVFSLSGQHGAGPQRGAAHGRPGA